MKRFQKFLYIFTVILLIAVAGVYISEKSGVFNDVIKKSVGDKISNLSDTIQSAVSSAVSSIASGQDQASTSKAAVKTVSKAAPSSKKASSSKVAVKSATSNNSSGNKAPVPVVKVDTKKPTIPSNSSSSASDVSTQVSGHTDFWGETGMTGLKVYEYGKGFLNAEEQKVYNELRDGITNLQNNITITTTCDKTDFEKIFKYVEYDHSEIFYMQGIENFYYSRSRVNGVYQYKYSQIKFSYSYSNASIQQMRSSMRAAALNLLSAANGKSSVFDKELALHDALVKSCTYDIKALEDVVANNNPQDHLNDFTAYGTLVEKKSVCDGYARAMRLLLNSVGIKSIYVTGTGVTGVGTSSQSSGGHAWNMAYIPDKNGVYHWYSLDATFDDPLVVNSDGSYSETTKPSYTYFNFIKDPSDTKHILGTYLASDPIDSQNFEVMPTVG